MGKTILHYLSGNEPDPIKDNRNKKTISSYFREENQSQ